MKNKKFFGTFGIVLAVVLVFIIVWAVISGKNSDLSASSDIENLSQPGSSGAPSSSLPEETSSQSDASPARTSQNSLAKFLHEQEDIRSDMLEDMDEEEPSGNASEDFLEGMIPHHEATIDMAKNYLKYGGTNPTLEQLAEEIITTRTSELQQMELLEDEIENRNIRDEEKEIEFLNTYHDILSRHQSQEHSSAQDIEQAFAEQMISHQQLSVDMAKSILAYTDQNEVRQLAEQIIKTGENEISRFQELVQ